MYAYFYSNRLCGTDDRLYEQGFPSVCSFLGYAKAFDKTNHNLVFAKVLNHNVECTHGHSKTADELVYRQQTMQVKWSTNKIDGNGMHIVCASALWTLCLVQTGLL